MKIGILTQPLLNNYGGLLQNYALQQVLVGLGHEPITIDHGFKDPPLWYRMLSRIKELVLQGKNPFKEYGPYIPTRDEQVIIRKNSIAFIDDYIKSTKKVYSSLGFKRTCAQLQLDAYVVGSDQCWRPCYNPNLFDMYLDFLSSTDVKRVAYAASFGTEEWEYSKRETDVCSRLAKKFDLITVREDSGVGLCKEYLGVEAKHVLDPTMLLNIDDYIKLIEKEGAPQSTGSLFNYVLDPSSEKNDCIQYMSEKLGLRTFRVIPLYNEDHLRKEDVSNHIEDCVYPPVTTWLRAFKDAEMTIVDSFHGMVFSILFNKPFWVIGNADRGLSRFESLLKMFNLEQRLVTVSSIKEMDLQTPIDWDSVNKILVTKRTESLTLLRDVLKDKVNK